GRRRHPPPERRETRMGHGLPRPHGAARPCPGPRRVRLAVPDRAVVARGSQVIHRVHNLGYGALIGILVAAPLVLQGRDPGSKPAAMQEVALVGFVMVVAEAVSSD